MLASNQMTPEGPSNIAVGSVCGPLLFLALLVVLQRLVEWSAGLSGYTRPRSSCLNVIGNFTKRIVGYVGYPLLGRNQLERDEETEDEWQGKLDHIERCMQRIVSNAERNIGMSVKIAEQHIKDHERLVTEELKGQLARELE